MLMRNITIVVILASIVGLGLLPTQAQANNKGCNKLYYANDVEKLAKRAWSRIGGPKDSQRESYRHRRKCHAPGKKNKIVHTWKKAKKKYYITEIVGLSSTYEKFSFLVAEDTKLAPRVIGAWCLAEGGPSYNPLNIGPGHHFGSLEGAANATVNLLNQSLYRGILKSAKKSDRKQISAIAASSWCPGCGGYESLLLGTYNRLSVR
jgi:hypothetical protein